MILSAVSLWKKTDLSNALNAVQKPIGAFGGGTAWRVCYNGRKTQCGEVKISARFVRPALGEKFPVVVLLPDLNRTDEEEIVEYFVQKGYAVLVPDYAGEPAAPYKEEQVEIAEPDSFKAEKKEKAEQILLPMFEGEAPAEDKAEEEFVQTEETVLLPYTVYPEDVAYANAQKAVGLRDLEGVEADQTCWFEWLHVALYSVKYLKERADVLGVGVVGVRTGGEIAWKCALSQDVQCIVPINAVGWDSYQKTNKFSETAQKNLSNERHRYIAGVESQSYAPFAVCPVLMMCAMRDFSFDYDRAYDTFSRIGHTDGSAIVYSSDSGPCIGPKALADMDLFLEKHLKGRAIYLPETLNVFMKEENGEFVVEAEVDEGGILEEVGVFYAEGDEKTRSGFRDWELVYRADGKNVKGGKITTKIKPFAGAKYGFAYAYARYINGFEVVSKIAGKKSSSYTEQVVRDRMIFDGTGLETFSVCEFEEYSLGGIFFEKEAIPKLTKGYAGISGVYSVSGIKTYKISSPRFLPDENAELKFDIYAKTDGAVNVSIEAEEEGLLQTYDCRMQIKGGGKWKRIILKPDEFKEKQSGVPLETFAQGNALSFRAEDEETEFSVTNILWL
ncbi:MAG: hypothetical protein IJV80_04445 [Clostridia bacterium]|nr:hypothetical protein [Clostridia bacterium]